MINYQKRLKKVSLFIRYNLVTKNNLKLTKTWKYILVFHCSLSKGADSLEEFVWDRGRIFSDRNIAFDYMINYQTLLKKVLVRVSYTNWLLRTTTDTHKKYSSYSPLLIRTQADHFVFRSPSSVRRNRKVTHVQYNHSGLDWFAFPCTILSRCHTQDCSRKEERLLLACKLLQKII